MNKQVETLLAEFREKHPKGGYSMVIDDTNRFRALPAGAKEVKTKCSREEADCLKKLIKRYA